MLIPAGVASTERTTRTHHTCMRSSHHVAKALAFCNQLESGGGLLHDPRLLDVVHGAGPWNHVGDGCLTTEMFLYLKACEEQGIFQWVDMERFLIDGWQLPVCTV